MDRVTTNRKTPNGGLNLRPVGLRPVQPPVAPRRPSLVSNKQALRFVEYVVGLATLLFWAWWLADGWGRDLVHAWRTEKVEPARAAAVVPTALASAVPELGRSLPVSVAEPEAVAPPVEREVPTPAAPIVDNRPTHLAIPSLGLTSAITEVYLRDGAWQVADYAVGYHHGTGLPGSGNVVLAGHKGTRGAVFSKLESLRVGDDIWIEAGNERYRYEVSATGKVWPDQVSIMQPSAEPILTLITCTNWDTERFVAVARLVEVAPAHNASINVGLAYGHGEG